MPSDPTLKERILHTIALIPEGKVCTYGRIAEYAGAKGRARFVGTTLKQLPKESTLPWHRVINSQGIISFPETTDQYRKQRTLLENEGVKMINNKVNLQHHLWLP